MRKAAVIGSPIAHSLSPRLHGYWLKQYQIQGTYEKIEVAPEQLADFVRALPQKYAGCNVTLPHKETILPLMDELDDAARSIGAVNTVVVKGGKCIGYNTDAFGFASSLLEQAPEIVRGHALVLGAGGAAKAVVVALKKLGFAKITITNRSEHKLAAFALPSIPWHEREHVLSNVDLLVNTTSLGMKGQPPLEISLDMLPPHAVVCDIVYKPLETHLLKQASQRGLVVVDGLGMLLWQAVPAFEMFFGLRPQVTDELRREVLA